MGAASRQMERGNRNRAQLQSFQERGDPASSDLRPGSQGLDLVQMIIRGRDRSLSDASPCDL